MLSHRLVLLLDVAVGVCFWVLLGPFLCSHVSGRGLSLGTMFVRRIEIAAVLIAAPRIFVQLSTMGHWKRGDKETWTVRSLFECTSIITALTP